MNNHRYAVIRPAIAAAMFLFCLCSNDLTGGNSSQTGNNGITISAKSLSLSGTTQAFSAIFIYAESYIPYEKLPGTCDSTIADMRGRFAFDTVHAGYYNLIVYDSERVRGASIGPIPIFPDSSFSAKLAKIPKQGFAAGTAIDSTGKARPFAFAFIRGSPFYTVTKQTGDFLLGPLPAGDYTIRYCENFAPDSTGSLLPMRRVVGDTGRVTIFPDSISGVQ